MTSVLLLSAFFLAPDTLPSTAAETATRIRYARETQAREIRHQHRDQQSPHHEEIRRVLTAQEREEFSAAVERLKESASAPDRDCRR